MKTSTILKINFLGLALGLTVYISYSLSKNGLSPGAKILLAMQGASNNKSSEEMNFNWNWCDTRVSALILPKQFKISQEGSKWVKDSGEKKILDFIDMEKWLSHFCEVSAVSIKAKAQQRFSPAMVVQFVSGAVEVLKMDSNGVFMWKDQVFTSPDFQVALRALSELPVELDKASSGAAK